MPLKALLIIDVQKDFCPGGALAIPNGDKVVPPINALISFARSKPEEWIICASRDWHPEETSHFEKWPVHCVRFTEGAHFHPDLAKLSRLEIIDKGVQPDEDAYSAFDGYAWYGSMLKDHLKKMKVEERYIAGLATEYCVKATAIDEANKGFRTFVIIDACRALNKQPGDEAAAIKEMESAGVIILHSTDILDDV